MPSVPLQLVEITTLQDGLLPAWLDLYETAFPPTERVFVSRLLGMLGRAGAHMLAAIDENHLLVGMAFYTEVPEARAAFLWYFAMIPEARGHGLGMQFYHAILNRLDADDRMLVFDVEIPELAKTSEENRLAQRRIGFYRRLGARVLGGIEYTQQVEAHHPRLTMYLMVHPLRPLTAQEACDSARIFLDDTITPLGEAVFLD
jgi:GNAT superfamily N-acetyltransferase